MIAANQGGDAVPSAAITAWQRRKPVWSRNETARWLNERSALVVAFMRRVTPEAAPAAPAAIRAAGQWMRDARGAYFDRAHERLAGCGADGAARARLTVVQVLG